MPLAWASIRREDSLLKTSGPVSLCDGNWPQKPISSNTKCQDSFSLLRVQNAQFLRHRTPADHSVHKVSPLFSQCSVDQGLPHQPLLYPPGMTCPHLTQHKAGTQSWPMAPTTPSLHSPSEEGKHLFFG